MHRRYLDAVLKVLALLDITGVLLTNERIAEFGLEVVPRSGKIQVFEKESAIVDSCRLLGFEDFMENRRFEGVVGRRKTANKHKKAVQVLLFFLRIVADVDVIRRGEAFEVEVDEIIVIQQLGLQLQQLLVLGFQKLVVNGERTETSRMAIAKIFDDPLWQIIDVRPL